mgnify:CR=1 FL=1
MIISETLRLRQSKALAKKVARYVGDDRERFGTLMQLIFDNDQVIAPRAAWAMNTCVEKYPHLVKPYLKKMIAQLKRTDMHPGVTRNIVRILQYVDVPENLLGTLTNTCYDLMLDPASPIAVKAFTMTVLLNICKREPELKNELKVAIAAVLENSTAATRSRAKHTLMALDKL